MGSDSGRVQVVFPSLDCEVVVHWVSLDIITGEDPDLDLHG